MTNDYFDTYDELTRGTLARAEDVNAIVDAIIVGFDRLPAKAKIIENRVTYAVDSGAINHYVVTLTGIAAYTAGLRLSVKTTTANDDASDINLNGIGAKAIKRFDGTALNDGDIPAGIFEIVYDGTDFRLVSQHGSDATIASAAAVAAAASASAASSSASAASGSASSASTSASTASTQATNASNSASAASTSASNASTSASNASSSASSASTSASNAATSASTATTQASNAATSASTASTQATNASNSASTASTQATNASNSASAAATSASNASTSETNAAASAVAAAASAAAAAASAAFQGYIYGLEVSAAGATATFGVAAGAASDGAASNFMILASAFTKTMASWAVGSGNGSLDTGAVAANTTYHIWLIGRTDGTLRDILVSLSASAPTMPTGYTYKRHIQSMKTDGSSQWPACYQYGDILMLTSPTIDFNSSPPVAATDLPLSVPTGIKVAALVNGHWRYNVGTNNLWVYSKQQSDAGMVAGGGAEVVWIIGAGNDAPVYNRELLTDTSGNIRQIANANAGTHVCVLTGWRHPRGASW